jgi:hypothetical protein
VLHLKRGAADLKKYLLEAHSRGMPLAVAWVGGTAGGDAAAATSSAARNRPDASSSGMPGSVGAPGKLDSKNKASAAAEEGDEEPALAWKQDINMVAELHAVVQEAGSALMVSSSSQASFASVLAAGGPLFLIADVGASTGNSQLAAALKVQQTPTLHVYQDMKVR